MENRTKRRLKIILTLGVLLVISFFWSGTKKVNPIDPDEVHKDAGLVEDKITKSDEKKNKDKKEDKKESDKKEEKDEKDKKKEKEDDKKEKEDNEIEKKDKTNKDIKVSKSVKTKQKQNKSSKNNKEMTDKELKELEKKQKKEKEKIIEQDKKNKDKKDKYLTDPTPPGKPKPVEWQDVTIDKSKPKKATLSVTCKTIHNNMHLFNKDKLDVLPDDGIIYPTKTVTFYQGESVFDVLLREMQNNKIHMEFEMTPIYNSHYIQGINNLYEFDCGELSGWMYRVNGWFPNYGASRYMLKDGDKIEWIYTCDLGRDIGGAAAVGGE